MLLSIDNHEAIMIFYKDFELSSGNKIVKGFKY